jgi:hypothetical protein
MTSVPKPLKFLRPNYPDLQSLYETWSPSEDKVLYLLFLPKVLNLTRWLEPFCRYPLCSCNDIF